MIISRILPLVFFLNSIIIGQVCCSLVGTVNSGSNGVVAAHYPSLVDFTHIKKWTIGASVDNSFNRDLNIKYNNRIQGYAELSRYIFTNTVGYFNSSVNFLNLSESISYSKSSTNIIHTTFSFGARRYISEQFGFFIGEISFPLNPYYSNDNFNFKSGVVPSASLAWVNSFYQNTNLVFSYNKNFRNKSDVFLDDNFNIGIRSNIDLVGVNISPSINLNYQKLIAPLTPYEINRQSRWLGITTIGFDIAPQKLQWNWLTINLNIPIYKWVSEVGFPDGTEPVPTIAVSINKNGIFKSNKNKSINIFE